MKVECRLIWLVLAVLVSPACVRAPQGQVGVSAGDPVAHHTYVERQPPPVRFEHIPKASSRDDHWVAGHWRWDGGEYVWVPGYYHARPRPQVIWVDGRWTRNSSGWYWIEGSWR